MLEYKQYHKLTEEKSIKFSIYIRDIPRSYILSVMLVEFSKKDKRGVTIESYTPSEGYAEELLKIEGRKSSKKLDYCIKLLEARKEHYVEVFKAKLKLKDKIKEESNND